MIRASRKCFLLLIYFNFKKLGSSELDKLIKILYVITIIQSIIYLIQIPTKLILLNSGTSAAFTLELPNTDWIRYYNFPFLLIFFFYFSLFSYNRSGNKRWFSIFLFSLTLLAPLHRSMIISIILTTIFLYLIYSTNKKKVLAYSTIIVIFLFLISPLLFQRLESGVTEVVSTVQNESSFEYPSGTFSFRLAHLMERARFIINSPGKIIFGLGFITEDSPETRYLNFLIGVKDENGLVNQVETADIAWSVLIVFTGLVGALLYLWLYYKTIIIILKNKDKRLYSLIGLGYLITVLFMSFTSSLFFDVATFILMTLSVHLVKNNLYNDQDDAFLGET